MAMSGCIYRRAFWFSCLLCALFFVATADAATRKFVNLPSNSSVAQNPSLPPSRIGDSLQITGQALEGEFLPGQNGTKGVPIKVLPRLDGSIPRMFEHAKSGMKGGLIGIAGSVGLALMLDQIDGFIEDNQVKVPGFEEVPTLDRWRAGFTTQRYFPTAMDACLAIVSNWSNQEFHSLEPSGFQRFGCVILNTARGTLSTSDVWVITDCPQDTIYNDKTGNCGIPSGSVDASESDFDLMFDYANQQNAEWLHGLLKDACNGSNNPSGCFDTLLDQAPMAGPSSVKGPSTTKTTTTTGPDGVTSQTVTTTNTSYDITYGDNYYDYRKTETTETKKDGVTQTETTETEPDEVEQEEKPQDEKEEEKDEPSPCEGSNCDGPAYEDQYEPTTETKEDSIDSYMDRVRQIPILTAIGGMFDISVSGSCPVWELHHAMPIMGTVMNIDLTFDFLCLSWFVAYGPFIRAVIYAVAAFAAVRVGLL